MTTDLNVNSTKLTSKYRIGKVERKILILVGNGYGGVPKYYPKEGCDSSWLVENLFGNSGFDDTGMEAKSKVIVSRALHSLYRKGLVKIGTHPSRGRRIWRKKDEDLPGMMGSSDKFVSLYFHERAGTDLDVKKIELESSDFISILPTHTKKWWMLTDAGKALVGSWKVLDKIPNIPNKTPFVPNLAYLLNKDLMGTDAKNYRDNFPMTSEDDTQDGD
jgi:hypothetical protein